MAAVQSIVKRYRRKAAAAYLTDVKGVPTATATLAKLASVGGGPVFRKAGPYAIYEEPDLDAYAEAKLGPRIASTSELPQNAA
jgi:hypothetical protein